MPEHSDPRWLDADQQRDWRAFLAGVTRINEHLELALRPFGLDLAEYEILVQLSEAERRSLRMSDLAHSARQSRSRLTHTVARMENKGLVLRRTCPSDRRGVIATMTEAGWSLLVQTAPAHVESVREILVDRVAPEDFAALGRLMRAVVGSDEPVPVG
jgi:DNA-binding MarR family transcriptional regulator